MKLTGKQRNNPAEKKALMRHGANSRSERTSCPFRAEGVFQTIVRRLSPHEPKQETGTYLQVPVGLIKTTSSYSSATAAPSAGATVTSATKSLIPAPGAIASTCTLRSCLIDAKCTASMS